MENRCFYGEHTLTVFHYNVFFTKTLSPLGKVDNCGKEFTDFFCDFEGSASLSCSILLILALKVGGTVLHESKHVLKGEVLNQFRSFIP